MLLIMLSKSKNGIECGSTRADPLALGVRYGEGNSGSSNTANALSPVKLPLVELGLFRASSSEDNCVPCGNPGMVADGKPQMVPSFSQRTFQIGFGSHPSSDPELVALHF